MYDTPSTTRASVDGHNLKRMTQLYGLRQRIENPTYVLLFFPPNKEIYTQIEAFSDSDTIAESRKMRCKGCSVSSKKIKGKGILVTMRCPSNAGNKK